MQTATDTNARAGRGGQGCLRPAAPTPPTRSRREEPRGPQPRGRLRCVCVGRGGSGRGPSVAGPPCPRARGAWAGRKLLGQGCSSSSARPCPMTCSLWARTESPAQTSTLRIPDAERGEGIPRESPSLGLEAPAAPRQPRPPPGGAMGVPGQGLVPWQGLPAPWGSLGRVWCPGRGCLPREWGFWAGLSPACPLPPREPGPVSSESPREGSGREDFPTVPQKEANCTLSERTDEEVAPPELVSIRH